MALFIGLILLALAGCHAEKQSVELYWPAPPDPPRIKFLRTYISEHEFKGRSITEILVGKSSYRRFSQPVGLAVSDDGQRLYIADRGWGCVFAVDFGKNDGFRPIGDQGASPGDAVLKNPIGVALDAEENLYVANQGGRAVNVYDRNGVFLRQIGRDEVARPAGLAIDRARGRLLVVDGGHSGEPGGHQIRVYDLSGSALLTIGNRGDRDGEMNFPTYVAVDDQGSVYVTDTGNARVQIFDAEGKFVRKFGKRGDRLGDFARPKGLALDTFGNVYITDAHWGAVGIFNQMGELLLPFGGKAIAAGRFQSPGAIAIGRDNKIFVADTLTGWIHSFQLVNTGPEDSVRAAGGGGAAPETKGGNGDEKGD